MKRPQPFPIRIRHGGFALVLVLIVLSLVVVMTTFFLSTATRERQSVAIHEASAKNQALSDTALNRVVGSINAATTESSRAGSPRSWVSQPGMVRTFDQSGNLSKVYKLYSWNDVVEADASYDPFAAANLPPADWATRPALFTNLNEPNQAGLFPVVDPGALADNVEGFEIGTNAVGAGADAIPMPVKWIYLLADGSTFLPPDGTTTSFSGIPGNSASNPIVGRIAYWTDDETAKVNLNTASEGSYWDWPKAATRDEMQFAGNPPVKGEYSRTPGHPAATSLSTVFPELDPGDRWADVSAYRSALKTIYDLLPRYRWSDVSSRGGTWPVPSKTFDYSPAKSDPVVSNVPNAPVVPGTDRLLASSGEWLLNEERDVNSALTPEMVARRVFFLTTSSRAPETTLLETPRVSLWPVTWPWNSYYFNTRTNVSPPSSTPPPDSTAVASNPWMAAEERLLAFAASLNAAANASGSGAAEHRYFFQRQNPDSPTHDWTQIARNRQLLDYLGSLGNIRMPGFGGALQSGLGGTDNLDFLLANTLNHVRASVNQYTLSEAGSAQSFLYSFTPISFRSTAGSVSSNNYREPNAFRAVPLRVTRAGADIQTAGNYPVLREATLLLYATSRRLPEPLPSSDPGFIPHPPSPADTAKAYWNPFNWKNLINTGASPDYPVGSQTTTFRAVLLLNFTGDATKSSQTGQTVWLRTTGNSFAVNGTPIGLPRNSPLLTQFNMGTPDYRGPNALRFLYSNMNTPKTLDNSSTAASNWNLISDEIVVDPSQVEFAFAGSSLTVEILPPQRNPDTVPPTATPAIATYTLDFSQWNGSYPIPLAPRWFAGDFVTQRPNHMDGTGGASAGKVEDYKTKYAAANPAILPTRWAMAEIAPATQTNIFLDPVAFPLNGTNNTPGNTCYALRAQGVNNLMNDLRNRLFIADERPGGGWTGTSSTGYPFPEGASSGAGLFSTQIEAGRSIITPYDVALSLVAAPSSSGNGDPRLGNQWSFRRIDQVLSSQTPRTLLNSTESPVNTLGKQFHTLYGPVGQPWNSGYAVTTAPQLLPTATRAAATSPSTNNPEKQMGRYGDRNPDPGFLGQPDTSNDAPAANRVGVLTSADANRDNSGTPLGDWSSGAGLAPDGGFAIRPDQDFQSIHLDFNDPKSANVPFFSSYGTDEAAALGYFSPNRQIASPISILGSLPASATRGWLTPLFSPNPAAGNSHPGLAANTNAPHHLLLDLFWMPVSEPYPISDQFATAGKINLNHQILPFPYIGRRTGLHALLKSVPVTALHDSLASVSKSHFLARDAANSQTRFPIDPKQTLDRFDTEIFDTGDVFRSASQLCEMWLVPEGRTASNVEAFWNDKQMTSDTARETPYDHLYSRVTTKSNTYTVHWKVQALKQTPASAAAGQWNENRDRVLSELEGATLIERFLDPNATNIPDYAADPSKITTDPLSNYYRWRTVSNTLFRR